MIVYKEVTEEVKKHNIVSVQCDVCKKEFEIENVFEVQEFYHIRFTGGYGSVFGDGSEIECDICQHCLKETIGPYCREV